MASSNRRVVVLAGAPDAGSLSWDEASRKAPLEASVENVERSNNPCAVRTAPSGPVWRSVDVKGGSAASKTSNVVQRKDTRDKVAELDHPVWSTEEDITQSDCFNAGDNATAGLPTIISQDLEIHNAFYEHSFALHEDSNTLLTASSQSTNDTWSSSNVEDSFVFSQGTKTAPFARHLTRLAAVPGAAYIGSIEPQTMTVDLVVGVVAVAAPKSITARRTKRQMDIVELMVGDESRSAFRISVWLPLQGKGNEETSGLSYIARQLRPHDIVLMNNIGLYVFKDQVHGQSLRRGLTSLQILSRKGTNRSELQAYYSAKDLDFADTNDPCLRNTKAVRDWLVGHVAAGANTWEAGDRTGAQATRDRLQTLPLDTQ